MKAAKKAMNMTDISKTIAEQTELKPKSVKAVFGALVEIANAEVKKTEKFAIPHLVTLKLKHKPATKAGKRMMFGKEVKVAAKPSRTPSEDLARDSGDGSGLPALLHGCLVQVLPTWSCHGGGLALWGLWSELQLFVHAKKKK